MKRPSFMQGRYGFDTLFFAVTALCLISALLSFTVLWRIPHIETRGVLGVTGLIMVINLSRVFSKDIGKRQYENIRFTVWLNGLFKREKPTYTIGRDTVRPQKNAVRSSPRCSCGAALDLPQSRGKHIVVCHKCGKRNLIQR